MSETKNNNEIEMNDENLKSCLKEIKKETGLDNKDLFKLFIYTNLQEKNNGVVSGEDEEFMDELFKHMDKVQLK